MADGLADFNEAIDCTALQLRKAKELVARQWRVLQEERRKLDEEIENFERRIEIFEQEKKAWEQEHLWVSNLCTDQDVLLCVGGKHLSTSLSTLTSQDGSMLAAMFSGRHKLALCPDGSIFIDRDPKYFSYVLNYLRTKKLYLPNPDAHPGLYAAIMDEFDYFCVALPRTSPELSNTHSITWDKPLVSETLSEDFPCSIECIRAVGDKLFCGRYDGYVDVLSLRSKKLLKRFKTDYEPIHCIEGMGNVILVAGGGCSTVCAYDLNVSQVTGRFSGHLQDVRCMKISGNTLVTGSNDHTLKVWELATFKCLYTLEGHEGDVTALDYNGHMLVSGSEDCTVRVWNTESRTSKSIYVGHVDRVSCVSLWKDNHVLSGSPDGTLKLWNLSSDTCERTLHTGFAAYVWSIDVCGDFVVCGCDENIKIWKLPKGESAGTLMGHQDHVWGVHILDNCLVSCSEDCTVRLWTQNQHIEEPRKKKRRLAETVEEDPDIKGSNHNINTNINITNNINNNTANNTNNTNIIVNNMNNVNNNTNNCNISSNINNLCNNIQLNCNEFEEEDWSDVEGDLF